jgi:hypothetical protein
MYDLCRIFILFSIFSILIFGPRILMPTKSALAIGPYIVYYLIALMVQIEMPTGL